MEAVVGKLSLRCRGQVDVKRRSNIRRSDGQHTLLRHAVEFVVPTDDPSVPLHQSKGEAETLLLGSDSGSGSKTCSSSSDSQLGMFSWVTLPMGAAQSPSAFCSVSTKMLERAGLVYNPGGNDAVLVKEYLQELYHDMVDNDWLIDGMELRNGELFIDGFLAPSQFATIYVDDITIVTGAPDDAFGVEGDAVAVAEHLRQWKLLIAVCRHQRLFLAAKKTCVGCEIIRLLGLCVSHTDIFADPERVKALADIPEPTTKSDVRCYCGLGNFYRNFAECFAATLGPIYELTKDDVPDKDVRAHFTIPLPAGDPRAATHFGVLADERADGLRYLGRLVARKLDPKTGKAADLSCREAWQTIKDQMCELTLLAQPDISKPMTIFTDSSQYAGAGAIAVEVSAGKLRIFDVWSKNFLPEQRNYSASEREALSIVLSVRKWDTWVCAAKFTIRMRTDHQALIPARQKINNARITSWFAQLQGLDFTISYVRGTSELLLVPDALSRLVRKYTDSELREQWSEGEHFTKVPCFQKVFERANPDVPIHSYVGVDQLNPVLDAVQSASASEPAAAGDDNESDAGSDVFDFDEPYDPRLETDFDEEELNLIKFADDTAAQLGGGLVNGINSSEFLERRQRVMTQPNVDKVMMKRIALIEQNQPRHTAVLATELLETDQTLRTVVAPTLRASTRRQTTASKPKSKATKKKDSKKSVSWPDQAPDAAAQPPVMAKGELINLDDLQNGSTFECHYNSTFRTIANRFGLDPQALLDLNRSQHPLLWSPEVTVDTRLERSAISLTKDGSEPTPADLMVAPEPRESFPTVWPPADADTEKIVEILRAPYGKKAVHGSFHTANKRWGLSKTSYAESKEFGALFKALGKEKENVTLRQADVADKTDPKQKVTVIGSYSGRFGRRKNRLYYLHPTTDQWLIVVPTKEAQQLVLEEFHNAFQTHPSAAVQYNIMKNRVWWPGMAKACHDYVRKCDHCQRFKHQHRKVGLQSTVDEPATFGHTYHLDLIDSLPAAGRMNADACLVCVDRFSRRTWIWPCQKTLTGKQAAEIFFKRIVCSECRGTPARVITDRGPQFISTMWQQLHLLMGTGCLLSSGHEHNLNAMCERHICSIETLLRGESWDTSKWLSKVHLAEFAMNSNPRPTLGGLSPIEIETGHRPNLPLDVSDEVMAMRTKHPDLDEHLADLKLLWAEVNESMKTVKEIQRGIYDSNRDSWGQHRIAVGDKVWLSSKDLSLPINQLRGSVKMTETYYGPYEVKGYVGPQTVTLKLGPNSKVHPNFSVAKLKPWHGTDNEAPQQLPEPDPDAQHEIKDILIHRGTGENIEYLVRWAHYGPEDASWVSQKDIKADRLIKKYLNRRKFLREYNEAATTTEDDAIMGFLGTSEQPVPGGMLPALSESLLLMDERTAYWTAVETQPYCSSS